ncbi:MAG: nucleotide pyrophosphohydrolase [Promethearchaeota archaeon]
MAKKNTLIEIQNLIDHWVREHGGYWSPLSMICAFMEELGELAREINSLEGYKPKKINRLNSNLEEELGDLLFSLVCIANHYKVDLGKELEKIMDKYSERDSKRF